LLVARSGVRSVVLVAAIMMDRKFSRLNESRERKSRAGDGEGEAGWVDR